MTHKERAMAALSHQETDRIPIDFGSTISTTIIMPAYENLKRYLGLQHQTQLMVKRGQTVIPDDRVLDHFDVDFCGIHLGSFKGGNYRELDSTTVIDAWGTTWKKAEGGHFINVNGPFQNAEPKLELLENHLWPNPDEPGLYEGLGEQAAHFRRTTDRAIILDLPVGILHQCEFLRGFGEFLMDLVINPEFADRMMDRVADIWARIGQNALKAVGKNVDVVSWGDDLASQESPLFSPRIYRQLVKPKHRRMIQAIKSSADVKVHYHTCGSVYDLIGDLIDIGVDALNPLQVSARNMDPARLKKEFGNRLAFWGGMDTHRVLPFGSSDEVRKEVRKMIDVMGKGGGYILATVHNIQAEVPPENIVAMFEEARSYRKNKR
ncbi:MAG TPA: uroporphyrinogen decarboxylase family protein [Thermodesulfobacteriota bacterium]|nr:uroporphyrinogen decarboxylase family protein [Thermodesulfobacteriota bacterium]